jgi:ribonuclease BN (tRNA processing enzyme)
MVTVRFLGSGDAFGSGGRYQACIHLTDGDTGLLLDCGTSSLVAMKRFGVDPNDIDAIIVSHLHGDHFGGIPFFILDAQLVSKRTRPLTIAGPPGVEKRVAEAMEALFPGSTRVQRAYETRFVELPERQTSELAGAKVKAFEVVHASGAPPYAFQVALGGRLIAYSGDTEWTEALVDAASGADLFICEGYTFDKEVRFHLNYQALAAHIERIACRRLMLTHMSSNMLRQIDGLAVEAAEDGMVVEL